jgi:fatty-acyl-CoA synthase
VRVTAELPKLASMKVDRQRLRREAWTSDDVYWRPAKGEPLRALDAADRARLDPLLTSHEKTTIGRPQ